MNFNTKEMLISIIIPVYNVENQLEICIESIKKQSYVNWELLLINDGSTDGSKEICLKYLKLDNRIKYYEQENQGASIARNIGLIEATGEYIMFIDSDDWIDSVFIDSFIKEVNISQSEFIISGLTIDKHDKNGKVIKKKYALKERRIDVNKKIANEIIDLVENEKINGPCCKLIKREVIISNKIFMVKNLHLQEDLHFNLEVLRYVKKLSVINECGYHYTKGIQESVTTRYYVDKYEMISKVHNKLLFFYSEGYCDESVLNRVYYMNVKNIYAGLINLFHPQCMKSRREKMLFIEKIIKTKKYNETIKNAKKEGIKYKALIIILKFKSKKLLYCIGKLVYILKRYTRLKY